MEVIYKNYCSKCKATDVKLTPQNKRINKNGNIVRYMNCLPCWRERQKEKYSNNKVKYRQYCYDSIARHKEKQQARNKLHYAPKTGRVYKPTVCQECRIKPDKLEGHHNDYTKPLEVEWLCTSCHNKK